MPALPPVNKVLRASFNFILGDSNMANILHWAYAGTQGSSTDLDTLAADLGAAWATNLLIGQSPETTLQDVQVEDLTSDTAPVGNAIINVAGSEGGSSLSAASAVVISHKIARRYRGGHPRTYIGGLTSNELLNPQQLTSARVTFWNGEWVDFRTAVAALSMATFTPLAFVSVSYRSGGVARVAPVVDPIIDSRVQDRICQQRRRCGPLIVE